MPGRDWPWEMSWRAVFFSPVSESFICCFGVGVGVWALASVIAEGAMMVIVMVVVFSVAEHLLYFSMDESSPYQ